MGKTKKFLENFKLQKALGDYKVNLNLGDKLHMFNCSYKVINSVSNGYTILEDEKNSRFAIPTPKLQLLMKKGLCKNYGALNLQKAMPKSPSSAAGGHGEGSGKTGPKGEPIGTVTRGSDGQWYKKISENPSRWIHVTNGTTHAAPGAEEDHPLQHPEDQKKVLQIREAIKTKTSPEHHEKLEGLLHDWLKQAHKYQSLRLAHNTAEVDDKGKKMPRTGIAESTMKQVYAEQDKAVRLKKRFIEAFIQAKKKD